MADDDHNDAAPAAAAVSVNDNDDDGIVPHPSRLQYWLAPRARQAVRRCASHTHDRCCVTPTYQVVIVAARDSIVEPTAFLQPIAPPPAPSSPPSVVRTAGDHDRDDDDDDHADNDKTSSPPPPFFFSVPVYVWPDTTLREVLETVLARSAPARTVLLTHSEDNDDNDASAAGWGVCVWCVSPDAQARPRVRRLATLRTDRPVFGASDHVTVRELRRAPWQVRRGDLLVVSPCRMREDAVATAAADKPHA